MSLFDKSYRIDVVVMNFHLSTQLAVLASLLMCGVVHVSLCLECLAW